MLPSWIKSKNNIPLPTYLLAIDTTKRKLAAASSFFASSSPSKIFLARSISSSWVSSSTRPISFKYILTGSLILTLLPNWFWSNSASASATWYIWIVSPVIISKSPAKSKSGVSPSNPKSSSSPKSSSNSAGTPANNTSSSTSKSSNPSSEITISLFPINSNSSSARSSFKSYVDK